MPSVSVLMPVRDAAPWLDEAIGSILTQSLGEHELLAVDDGSRDESPAILASHAARDARVRVLATTAAERGIVAALNLGLAAARAPLVARMDADDVAHPERLAKQRDALGADRRLFAVGCRVRGFPAERMSDGMRRYLDWQNSLLSSAELARDRFVESPVLHPSLMMRTAPLRDCLGGWRDQGWPEDWDLVLRAFAGGLAIARVPEFLLRWRLHQSQAWRSDPRYSEQRFLAARASFLAEAVARDHGGRDVWILGAGPIGKRLGKALAAHGARITGFVDVDPKKIGGRVSDGARAWPVVSMAELDTLAPRPLAIAAVGRAGGRRDIRRFMAERGWAETADYIVAA